MKKYLLLFAPLLFFTGCDSGPQITWKNFDEPVFAEALKSGKPTLVYFYAAWCGPCRQMRATTLSDPEIVWDLNDWNTLKADMSFRENKTTIRRHKEFGVWALPTFVFYDAQGNERLRKTGFIPAASFADAMRETESLQSQF